MFEAEFKRDKLRETLHEMAVWNIHDTKLIQNVCGTVKEDGSEVKPKLPKDMSISCFVRKTASKVHKKERDNPQSP